jgi:hypothetical protein
MPCIPGIPITPVDTPHLPAGPLNPVDWIDGAGNLPGALQQSLMRGTPGMAHWQRRQIPQVPTIPRGREVWFQAPSWDRGAAAFAPNFGIVPVNPIGSGVFAPYRIPTIAGPGARYEFGAIWFDVQTVPTSIHLSPSMSAESLNALIATSFVAAMYPTTG